MDGVQTVENDRILLCQQLTASGNGIYVVHASGGWTRAGDADTGAEVLGATVVVSEGTTWADTVWMCTTNAPITVGTTGLAWTRLVANVTPTVVKSTTPSASDYGLANIPTGAVWIQSP
jgi:hypothetical protein